MQSCSGTPVDDRWLSNDPIGISGGLNQYVFCADNPVNFRDPFGLCKRKYTVLSGENYLKRHKERVAKYGFWGEWAEPILSGGYFGDSDVKLTTPNAFYLLDCKLYTASEIGNVAAGATSRARSYFEFLAVKYGGEFFPGMQDGSGFSRQNWDIGWGQQKPFVWLIGGVLQVIDGATGSWDMNNRGARSVR